jgi:hypothetical protein
VVLAYYPTRPQQPLTRPTELEDIVSTSCQDDELIDNALRAYLNVTTTYKGLMSCPLLVRVSVVDSA